jgi:CheY-like chemotaxis protein
MDRKILRIIVAGDHTSSMMQLVVLTRRLGYEVMPAESGAEALSLMEETVPDLVIFDGNLSAQDGVSALKQIKNDRRWSSIPVIMMAARHSKTSLDEYIHFGYEGLLTTPFDLRKMNILVQEYLSLEKRKSRKKLRAPFSQPVTLVCCGQTTQYQAANLSEGGIYLLTSQPLAVATEIELFLPISGSGPLQLTGVVIYHKGSCSEIFNAAPGMAIKFQHQSTLSAEALSAFITDMLLKDLPRGGNSIVSFGGQDSGRQMSHMDG